MPKYIVLEKGNGEGCDYTIGCNQRWRVVEFDGDIKKARQHFGKNALYGGDEDAVPDDYGKIYLSDGPHQLTDLIILPYENVHVVDMDALRDQHNNIIDELENEEKYDAELAEYERLKHKFGD